MDFSQAKLRALADREEIKECLYRYARGVDRGDLELVRSTYFSDAFDDHVEYKGNVDGLIEWLRQRFASVDNSIHFLGNCLIEFASESFAFAETYFASRRLRLPTDGEKHQMEPTDAICRQSWGRYLDHFEKRNGEWRVAHRVVVMEAVFTTVAKGGVRSSPSTWAHRDRTDLLYSSRQDLFSKAAKSPT